MNPINPIRHLSATRRMAPVLLALGLCWLGQTASASDAAAAKSAPSAPATPSAPIDAFLPNPHLSANGIPPIPASIAEQAAHYNDFRGNTLVDWHPVERSMLISTRSKGATAQLHLVAKPLAKPEQITDFADPVRIARFEPKQGQYILFEKDEGGSEADQVYRLDLNDGRKVTLLTDPRERHHMGPWNHAGTQIVLSSIGLDKTAASGSRAEINTDIYALDPKAPQDKRKLASLPGGGWGNFHWSPDDQTIVAINAKSINDASVWLINVADGKARQILPDSKEKLAEPVHYSHAHFTDGGKQLIVTSDRNGEFAQLMQIDLTDGKAALWSGHLAWDVTSVAPSKHGHWLATTVNREGLSELHLFDRKSGAELARPALPFGSTSHAVWHRKNAEFGVAISNAHSPGEIYSWDMSGEGAGKLVQWTRQAKGSVDTAAFPETEIVRWNSFDSKSISGLITRAPKDKFPGPRPVFIAIHGGPEAQAQIGFLGRNNYMLTELGITLIQPNVRGSNGFGKSFLKLDDGFKREDSVKDIGALLDWIATQPDLDAKHVMVSGGSYGGYMSLAVATHYAERIVGSIDTVGISHFVTFLTNTESYRRDLRRVEYGDERIPEMRAFLEKISPLNNAGKIKKPLFVVQGKNDPRVPVTEAEQVVARVRKNEIPVWYLVADNEGHGFQRKPNQDFLFFAQIRFMQEYLLK
jgi:dipeptidyl aminopeptidase/acylaminoacyl peptidase